ncbi:MAG: hypothetical protein ACJAZI_001019 [Cycloclasticus sp.]|jgi:hypothetical protein
MTITRRGFKAVETNAAQRTKALTVKFMQGEYKTLRLCAMDKDKSHQDLIYGAVMKLIN